MKTRGVLKINILIVFLAVVLGPCAAKAEYHRTGPAIGHESHGFGITYNDQHTIAAVEKDGQLYEFKEVWDKVDTYNEATGMCTLYTKNGLGMVSRIISSRKEPILLEKTSKGYRRIKADYVTFPCIKR